MPLDEASTSDFKPTGTSQVVTMSTVSEPTSVATELASRGESSIQCETVVPCLDFAFLWCIFYISSDEAATSDVSGIWTTSSVLVPTSTPLTGKMDIIRQTVSWVVWRFLVYCKSLPTLLAVGIYVIFI